LNKTKCDTRHSWALTLTHATKQNSWENEGYRMKICMRINKPGKVNIKINGVKIQVSIQ